MSNLIPPDTKQCQAETQEGGSAFRLGGRPRPKRCTNVPTVIATEVRPGKDGVCGSMSLCDSCQAVMVKQLGVGFATISPVMHEYMFDVKLLAAFRFKAPHEQAARMLLAAALDCETINAGEINGCTLVGEASMDGEADLIEVDGEPYDG